MVSWLPIFFVGLIAFLVWIFLKRERSPTAPRETPRPNLKHRAEVIQWAKDVLADPDRHAIIDTETTGLGDSDEIIQIAAIDTDGKILLDSFVKPISRKSIPAAATRIHGINMKMLKGAPTYPEVAPLLDEILSKRNIICYNAAFDGRLINQTAQKTGLPVFKDKWTCAMLAYARYRQIWNQERNDYRWHKLPEADHSALGDCRMTLKVIKKMAGEEEEK